MTDSKRKNGFYTERIRPVVVTAVLTITCITLVSVLYLYTRERVIANEGLVLKKAVLYAAGETVPGTNQEINELYGSRVTEKDGVYSIKNSSGDTKAYALIQAGPGLWGEIQAVVAFDKDLASFAGVDFISQNETPGLGARITESWFKEQLRGKRSPLTMNPEGTGSSSPTEIDAITGASRTSEYALSILNKAGEKAAELKGRLQ